MTVTIVVPVKNEQDIIEECIRSILHQTRRPDVVHVLDNNSTDNTASIIQSLHQQFAVEGVELKYTLIEQGNQIEARSHGFGTATTDIIVTIDADTILEEHWVQRAVAVFEARPEVVGVGGIIWSDKWFPSAIQLFFFLFLGYLLRPWYYFYGSNGAFRASAYRNSGGLEGNRAYVEKHQLQEAYDDLWVSARLLRVGKVVAVSGLHSKGLIRKRVIERYVKRRSYVRQFLQSFQMMHFLKKEGRARRLEE